MSMSRWLFPVVIAAGLVAATAPPPALAQSGDDLARVLVDVADVVLRGGEPYYRYGDNGYDNRLIVGRDRYGRPVYYRNVARSYGDGPPYGNAYGYYGDGSGRQVKCNRQGRCTMTYYDPRYDSNGRYGSRSYGYEHRRWHRDHDN